MELVRSVSSKLMRLSSSKNLPMLSPPENIVKLNDLVYEFYKPDKDPKVEILFFHGLQIGDHPNSYWSTWTTTTGDGDQVLWPQTWLSEVFPDARILSISYETSLDGGQQDTLDLHTIGSNLIQSLSLNTDVGQTGCPVVLVGHSFGGLVIKQLCTQAQQDENPGPSVVKIKQFLENVRGCFFYATPHHGVPLNMAGSFVKGPLLEYVKLLGKESSRLGADFRQQYTQRNWQIGGLGEAYPTATGSFKGIVVPEASAREGSFSMVQADHISICKPKSKISGSFQHLTMFIEGILERKNRE